MRGFCFSCTRERLHVPVALLLSPAGSREAWGARECRFARNQQRVFVAQNVLAGGLVQTDGGLDEGRERLLVDLIALVDVDCAPGVAFEAEAAAPLLG